MPRLFGTDGVRGLANRELTADLALGLAQAAAAVLTRGRHADELRAAGRRPTAVVARDPRVSGEFLTAAVAAGLASSGVDVLDAGVIPTPATAFLIDSIHADFGVMISASHNPAPDNGIKFFSYGGTKLPDEVEDRIESYLGKPKLAPSATGSAESVASPTPKTATWCTCSAPCRTVSKDCTSCSTAPTAQRPASRPRPSATQVPESPSSAPTPTA
jgi:phosphoglucosamine mutase